MVRHRIANPTLRKGRVGSTPTLSANTSGHGASGNTYPCQGQVAGSIPAARSTNLESNAAGMVLRLALKTRFSEMGWGSTPLLSANDINL